MKIRLFRTTIVFFIICLSFLSVSLPASADELVVTNKGLVIHQNQHVENLFVFGHNATINGSVHNVVVINGNLKINRTAKIRDLVLVLGGSITQEKGARVTHNLLAFHWNNNMVNMLIVSLVTLAASWFLKVVFSVLFVLVTFLLTLLLRKRLNVNRAYIKHLNWKVVLIGISTSIVVLAITVILFMTVVGIPFVFLLMVPIAYFFFETLSNISLHIGRHLLSSESSTWLIALVGSCLVVSTFNFPFFGIILFLFVLWLAMGIMVLRTWRRISKNSRKVESV